MIENIIKFKIFHILIQDNYDRNYAFNALEAIQKAGANTVRVQLRHLWNDNSHDKVSIYIYIYINIFVIESLKKLIKIMI